MPVLDGLVMVHGEIVLRRLVLKRTGDRRPGALGHDREFVPSVVQQQGDHRFSYLCVRRLGPHEGLHLRGLVVRAFVTEHRYVAGFGDGGFDVAGAFRSEEGHDPVTDHVDHRSGSFDGLSSRVAPSHHQLHVRQNVRIVVDLVEGHSQSAGNGETLTVLEAALDGREVADGQVPRQESRVVACRPQIPVSRCLLALSRWSRQSRR